MTCCASRGSPQWFCDAWFEQDQSFVFERPAEKWSLHVRDSSLRPNPKYWKQSWQGWPMPDRLSYPSWPQHTWENAKAQKSVSNALSFNSSKTDLKKSLQTWHTVPATPRIFSIKLINGGIPACKSSSTTGTRTTFSFMKFSACSRPCLRSESGVNVSTTTFGWIS